MARDRSFWKRYEEVRREAYNDIDENTSEQERNYLRKFASKEQIAKKESNVWTPNGYKYIPKDEE